MIYFQVAMCPKDDQLKCAVKLCQVNAQINWTEQWVSVAHT
jgi:hypothetical protein